MTKTVTSILLSITAMLLLSCGNQQDAAENDQAYEDYRDFVTETETKANTDFTETELRAMWQSELDTSLWQTESAEIMQDYEDRKRNVQEKFDSYDAARQQEIRDLDTRYTKAYQKQAQKYRDVSHRYKLRKELLGMPVSSDDMSDVAPAELATVYERFVQNVKTKADSMQQKDWELVEGWWSALNNRQNEVASELSSSAKNTIAEATQNYRQLREAATIQ